MVDASQGKELVKNAHFLQNFLKPNLAASKVTMAIWSDVRTKVVDEPHAPRDRPTAAGANHKDCGEKFRVNNLWKVSKGKSNSVLRFEPKLGVNSSIAADPCCAWLAALRLL